MNESPFQVRAGRDSVTIPTIWIAVALSLLIHAAVLWRWAPRMHLADAVQPRDEPLTVHLSPPPGPPRAEAAVPPAPPPPAARATPRPAAPRARHNPAPVAPGQSPSASEPSLLSVKPDAPAPIETPRAAPTEDFASYVAARRRERGEGAPAAPPPEIRPPDNRVALANLAQRPAAFGYDPSRSGGIFEVRRIGAYSAEFMFYGWNKDARRNTAQLIEVTRDDSTDIHTAIVRRMIAIIRDHESGDFAWASRRLGRDVMLSARLRDSAALEAFLRREFFE